MYMYYTIHALYRLPPHTLLLMLSPAVTGYTEVKAHKSIVGLLHISYLTSTLDVHVYMYMHIWCHVNVCTCMHRQLQGCRGYHEAVVSGTAVSGHCCKDMCTLHTFSGQAFIIGDVT